MQNSFQKTVYQVIKLSKQMDYPFLTKRTIKEELLGMPELARNNNKRYAYKTRNRRNTKLDDMLSQALMHLKKKNLIKNLKRGHWTTVK